jgi:hypothetical protein
MGGKDLFKYLEGEKLKSPSEEDMIKNLKTDQKINIGFIELKSTIKKGKLTYKAQEIESFINATDLEEKEIEVTDAYNLTIGKKDKKGNVIDNKVIIGQNPTRPKEDKSIGLGDVISKYKK